MRGTEAPRIAGQDHTDSRTWLRVGSGGGLAIGIVVLGDLAFMTVASLLAVFRHSPVVPGVFAVAFASLALIAYWMWSRHHIFEYRVTGSAVESRARAASQWSTLIKLPSIRHVHILASGDGEFVYVDLSGPTASAPVGPLEARSAETFIESVVQAARSMGQSPEVCDDRAHTRTYSLGDLRSRRVDPGTTDPAK